MLWHMTKILIYRGFLETKYNRTYNGGAQADQKPVKVPKTGKIRYKYEKKRYKIIRIVKLLNYIDYDSSGIVWTTFSICSSIITQVLVHIK
jgi:hypothetical protein